MYFCIHDRGLDASYMEANGNQNVDPIGDHCGHPSTPPVKAKFYPLPTPIAQFCGVPVPELREVLRVTYF